MNYIVPILYKLQNWFNYVFYFIQSDSLTVSTVVLIELVKLGLVNDRNLVTVTQMQFNDIVERHLNERTGKDLFFIKSYDTVFRKTFKYDMVMLKSIVFTYHHGVDEEIFFLKHDHKVLPNELYLNSCLYSEFYKNKIKGLYNLDLDKKTIVLFETTSIGLLKDFGSKRKLVSGFGNKMIEKLLMLKNRYNVIIRFHPQDYHGFMGGVRQCHATVCDNFVIDYTPIPVFNFYEFADIIMTSRFSASGYQAIFVKGKKMIFIETDFDARKKHDECDGFVKAHMNSEIKDLMDKKMIVTGEEAYIVCENDLDKLDDVFYRLENGNDRNVEMDRKMDIFVRNRFGIDRMDFCDIVKIDPVPEYLKKFGNIV